MRIYGTEISSCNILRVAAGTTGYCGGDAGHGGRTIFEIEDLGNTDISITPIKGEFNGGVLIELGGDSEMETFVEALEWAASTLRKQMAQAEGGSARHRYPYAEETINTGQPEPSRPSRCGKPPSEKQMALLQKLRYTGPPITDRREASEAITALLAAGKGGSQ